jgi:hypothetical protein
VVEHHPEINTGKGPQINTEKKPQTRAIKGKRPIIDLAFEYTQSVYSSAPYCRLVRDIMCVYVYVYVYCRIVRDIICVYTE